MVGVNQACVPCGWVRMISKLIVDNRAKKEKKKVRKKERKVCMYCLMTSETEE